MLLDRDGFEVQNTKCKDMRPEPAAKIEALDDVTAGPGALRLQPVVSGVFFSQIIQYQIIVENWEKRLKGRVRREYEQQFTQTERNRLQKWYVKLHRWHLISGVPDTVLLKTSTITLLQKAVHFFATC